MKTRVTELEAGWLVSLAGFPEVRTIEPLQGGWDNTNVLLGLSDGSRVVLKVWNANTVEEVLRVIKRHCHLDRHGIPLSLIHI